MIKKRLTWILIIALVVAVMGGCSCPVKEQKIESDTIKAYGTIVYNDIEGGFYGILDADGNKYNPLNLGDEYMEDGLKIYFEAVEDKEVSSFRMWGKNIRISKIEKQ